MFAYIGEFSRTNCGKSKFKGYTEVMSSLRTFISLPGIIFKVEKFENC